MYSHETEEAEADDADDDDVNCSWLEPGTSSSSKRQFSSRSLLVVGEKIATEVVVVVVWHSLQPRRCSCRGTIAASSSSNGSSCTCTTIIIIYGPQLSWSFVPFLLLPLFSLSLFIIVCWWCACLYFCFFFFYACACISLGGSRSSSMVI